HQGGAAADAEVAAGAFAQRGQLLEGDGGGVLPGGVGEGGGDDVFGAFVHEGGQRGGRVLAGPVGGELLVGAAAQQHGVAAADERLDRAGHGRVVVREMPLLG